MTAAVGDRGSTGAAPLRERELGHEVALDVVHDAIQWRPGGGHAGIVAVRGRRAIRA